MGRGQGQFRRYLYREEICQRVRTVDPDRSMMKHSKKTGREFSKAEALDILTQCKAIRWSVAALEERDRNALRKPDLRVIKSKE